MDEEVALDDYSVAGFDFELLDHIADFFVEGDSASEGEEVVLDSLQTKKEQLDEKLR